MPFTGPWLTPPPRFSVGRLGWANQSSSVENPATGFTPTSSAEADLPQDARTIGEGGGVQFDDPSGQYAATQVVLNLDYAPFYSPPVGTDLTAVFPPWDPGLPPGASAVEYEHPHGEPMIGGDVQWELTYSVNSTDATGRFPYSYIPAADWNWTIDSSAPPDPDPRRYQTTQWTHLAGATLATLLRIGVADETTGSIPVETAPATALVHDQHLAVRFWAEDQETDTFGFVSGGLWFRIILPDVADQQVEYQPPRYRFIYDTVPPLRQRQRPTGIGGAAGPPLRQRQTLGDSDPPLRQRRTL